MSAKRERIFCFSSSSVSMPSSCAARSRAATYQDGKPELFCFSSCSLASCSARNCAMRSAWSRCFCANSSARAFFICSVKTTGSGLPVATTPVEYIIPEALGLMRPDKPGSILPDKLGSIFVSTGEPTVSPWADFASSTPSLAPALPGAVCSEMPRASGAPCACGAAGVPCAPSAPCAPSTPCVPCACGAPGTSCISYSICAPSGTTPAAMLACSP